MHVCGALVEGNRQVDVVHKTENQQIGSGDHFPVDISLDFPFVRMMKILKSSQSSRLK